MGWWALLGMVAMAGQAGSDADRVRADPYCRDIFGIVAASGQGFAPIKGAWRTDDDEWVSLITLPGADECSIRPWTEQDLEFACKWAVADTATANATARTMADKLRWCAWHGLDSPSGPLADMRSPTARGVTFLWELWLSRTMTKVSVEARQSPRSGAASVQFRVERRR